MTIRGSAGHMAELENAAWKDDRRFRLLSVDGGVLSFVDLFMHTPSKPRSSAGPPSEHLHEDQGKNISITGEHCHTLCALAILSKAVVFRVQKARNSPHLRVGNALT